MSLSEDTHEHVPGTDFRGGDEATQYWLKDGQIHWRQSLVTGADVDSFRFYLGGFAKDQKHGYILGRRLTGCDGPGFRALNFTFATDGRQVWTLGGAIEGVDPETFAVCDDGFLRGINGSRVPCGYGKDARRVVYHEANGKPALLRTADAATFVSLNDGHFGKDRKTVFCGAIAMDKAQIEHWQRLEGHYNRDKRRVFHYHRDVKGADPKSFEVVRVDHRFEIARDREHFYRNERQITEAEFEDFSSR